MNVFIIPEDFRNDQYILKPLFTRLFRRIGVSSTNGVGVPGPLAWRCHGERIEV